MTLRIYLLVAVITSLTGCAYSGLESTVNDVNANASERGSPFRWDQRSVGDSVALTKVLIGIPAETSADKELQNFTRRQISMRDDTGSITQELQPTEVRLVAASENHVQEVWVYEIERVKYAFVIDFQPADGGGTDITITGPWK